MNVNIKQDIKRYRELSSSSILKEPSFILILLFRINKSINNNNYLIIRYLLLIIFVPLYKMISILLGISIPRNCEIGGGLVIFHYGSIALNPYSKIGMNCTIRQGVSIGNKKTMIDVPIIGNEVDIGAGAILIGDILIGNNVSIGANAVVLKDVPDNHIAVGVPARIIPKNTTNS